MICKHIKIFETPSTPFFTSLHLSHHPSFTLCWILLATALNSRSIQETPYRWPHHPASCPITSVSRLPACSWDVMVAWSALSSKCNPSFHAQKSHLVLTKGHCSGHNFLPLSITISSLLLGNFQQHTNYLIYLTCKKKAQQSKTKYNSLQPVCLPATSVSLCLFKPHYLEKVNYLFLQILSFYSLVILILWAFLSLLHCNCFLFWMSTDHYCCKGSGCFSALTLLGSWTSLTNAKKLFLYLCFSTSVSCFFYHLTDRLSTPFLPPWFQQPLDPWVSFISALGCWFLQSMEPAVPASAGKLLQTQDPTPKIWIRVWTLTNPCLL